jgi:septum formation protein
LAERLILASASPQRRAILAQVGADFTVAPTHVEELESGDPEAVASENARRKALAADPAPLVLGADTLVTIDGEVLGKPRDAAHARALLARLAGRTHLVVGGIALAERGALAETAVVVTRVTFRPADGALLDWYVATGEWRGRAGGYAIQGAGAVLVDSIEGDYLNVVGLPLARLLTLRPELLPTGARPEGPAA